MIPFHKSIGFRILGISFILLAMPLLVDSFILVKRSYEHTIGDAKSYLIEISRIRELPITQLQPLNKPLLDVLVQFLDLKEDFPDKEDSQLNETLNELAKVGGFYGIFLVKHTENGRYVVVASSISDSIGKDYTEFFNLSDLFSLETMKKGYVNYISYDSKTMQPYFIVAHPIMKNGNPAGILAISDNISSKLKQLLAPDTHVYNVKFALILPSTIIFAATDPQLRFQYFFPLSEDYRKLFLEEEPVAESFLPSEPLRTKQPVNLPFIEFQWEGNDQIGYIKDLPGENFSFLTYASKEEIFKSPLLHFFNIFGSYAAILIIGGSIAAILSKRMVRPMQNLSTVMQGIQEGNLDLRYKKDVWGFEINMLGQIFNEMLDAVLRHGHEIEDQRVKREIYERELKLGQQVQLNLLPQTMPIYPKVDLAEKYIPAIEVGGDFYDVFIKENHGQEQLVLSVADASGKGVRACFYSLSLRNMLRTFAKAYNNIAQVMKETNNLFCKDTGDTGMFVTTVMGFYDYQTKVFSYYSCGHVPTLLRRKSGKVELLNHMSMAMGLLPLENEEAHHVQLEVGDALVMYSDGITEAHNIDSQLFGEDRLVECLEKEGWRSAEDTIEQIVMAVKTFVGEAHQHDDITILVMKVEE